MAAMASAAVAGCAAPSAVLARGTCLDPARWRLAAAGAVGGSPLSAASVLDRADDAMRQLVHPGEVLYRRTRREVVDTSPTGHTARHAEISEEWIEGGRRGAACCGCPNRLASSCLPRMPSHVRHRFEDPTSRPPGRGRRRYRMVGPTAAEMGDALAALPEDDRFLVLAYRAEQPPLGVVPGQDANRERLLGRWGPEHPLSVTASQDRTASPWPSCAQNGRGRSGGTSTGRPGSCARPACLTPV